MKPTSREWTVLTWNVQGTKRTDLDRATAVIAAEAPDVVVLQEVRRPQAREFAERLSMTQCWAEKHLLFRPVFPGRAEGASILTPHLMSAEGHAQVSDISSKRSYRRRIVQWATITRGDASGYRVYKRDLSPHDLAAERLTEANRIAELVQRHGDAPPAVIAGDLNDEGEPQIIAALPGIEVLVAPATNPAGAPTKALDHVLVPPGANGVSIDVPAGDERWAELSDHLPVTVRFSIDWVAGHFAG